MRRHQLKEDWDRIKGTAKASWESLTRDEIIKAEESLEKLYNVVNDKFGGAQGAVKSKVEKFAEVVNENTHNETRTNMKPEQAKEVEAMNQPIPEPTKPDGKSQGPLPEQITPPIERHLMRNALGALLAVGVVLVIARLSRRAPQETTK